MDAGRSAAGRFGSVDCVGMTDCCLSVEVGEVILVDCSRVRPLAKGSGGRRSQSWCRVSVFVGNGKDAIAVSWDGVFDDASDVVGRQGAATELVTPILP